MFDSSSAVGMREVISGGGIVAIAVSGAGCRDSGSAPEDPAPMSLDGSPCDAEASLRVEEDCTSCVCMDDGRWRCFRTSCAQTRLFEPTAELLVVLDDSSSMGPERQARLARGMSSLVERFDAWPDPVALRVAVTTTSHRHPACEAGATHDGALRLQSCREHEEDFGAREASEEPIPDDAVERGCRSVCALPELRTRPTVTADDAAPKPRPWLERYGAWDNLEGEATFEQALACAVPQGLHGCDFESPLEAAASALDRTLDPDDPAAGFVRPRGPLTVLVVTDEADCSAAAPWGTVFDPEGTRRFWSDPEADAPTSAVCWNAGVWCEGGPGRYDGCAATNIDTAQNLEVPDDNAVLVPVASYARRLRAWGEIKQALDPVGDVDLVVIGGVPSGYDGDAASIEYTDGAQDPEYARRYGVGPGCERGDERAVPPARLLAAAERLDFDDAQLHAVCDADYGPALASVAASMLAKLPSTCVPYCVADAAPQTPALEPDCVFVAEWTEGGSPRRSFVPPCQGATPGDEVCVQVRVGERMRATCADAGFNLELALRRPPGVAEALDVSVSAVCRPSADRAVDCPELP